jgi:hypothetical protein
MPIQKIDMFEMVKVGWRGDRHWSKDFPGSRRIFENVERKRFADVFDRDSVRRDYQESLTLRERRAAQLAASKAQAQLRLAQYRLDLPRLNAERAQALIETNYYTNQRLENRKRSRFNFYNPNDPVVLDNRPYKK